MDLTQEIVKELLDCDIENGVLTWRERNIKWFDSTRTHTAERRCKIWNAKNCGKQAGTITHGYRILSIFNSKYRAHNIIWLYTYGETIGFGDEIDHINGLRDDNRIDNLRKVTRKENSKNAALRKNNTSGYKGVTWCKRDKKWIASITVEQKRIHLGNYDIPEEAFAAYVKAAKQNGFTERHIYGK